MKIVEAQLEDWEFIYNLYINDNPCKIIDDKESFKEVVKNYLHYPNNYNFILENELGCKVGYIKCQNKKDRNRNRLYLSSLIIKGSEQGKGYGKLLIDYVIDYAQENGFKEVTLDVVATNSRAIKFYEKHGFQVMKYLMKRLI